MGSTPNDMNNLSIKINKMVMNYIAKNKIRACNDVINNWVYLSIGRTNHSSMQKNAKDLCWYPAFKEAEHNGFLTCGLRVEFPYWREQCWEVVVEAVSREKAWATPFQLTD